MMVPESRLFCSLDGLSSKVRAQARSSVLQDLGLLETVAVPVFEEVVQTAAHFTGMAMALLTVVDGDRELLKATFGLTHLGLMNELVRHRFIELQDSFAAHVVDSHQPLVISDTHAHPAFAQSLLTQQYGIRSYIGVPLVASDGACIGVLSVLDSEPREFNLREIEFLMMTARFAMSDYERLHGLKLTPRSAIVPPSPPPSPAIAPQTDAAETIPLKFKLVAHLTQELRTPLTSVMGMASVLNREIYGPLTLKQREYLGIIHNSGEYLLSLVKEILELSQLNLEHEELSLTSVDIEMLCQQSIGSLQQAAQRREQEIRLTVEPGNRIWALDKEKIRQTLYHLIFSVVQSSNAGSVVHLHAANKVSGLRLTLWVTHPCLDAISYESGLNEYEVRRDRLSSATDSRRSVSLLDSPPRSPEIGIQERLHLNLGFLLSRQLIGLHGGEIQVQTHSNGGDRYVVTVPRLAC